MATRTPLRTVQQNVTPVNQNMNSKSSMAKPDLKQTALADYVLDKENDPVKSVKKKIITKKAIITTCVQTSEPPLTNESELRTTADNDPLEGISKEVLCEQIAELENELKQLRAQHESPATDSSDDSILQEYLQLFDQHQSLKRKYENEKETCEMVTDTVTILRSDIANLTQENESLRAENEAYLDAMRKEMVPRVDFEALRDLNETLLKRIKSLTEKQ